MKIENLYMAHKKIGEVEKITYQSPVEVDLPSIVFRFSILFRTLVKGPGVRSDIDDDNI